MEMPESELIERFINIASNDPGGRLLPSQEIKRLHNTGTDREKLHKMLVDEIGIIFRNKLKICSTPSMTSERFNEIITSLNEKTDVLIVDGLSMMGGSGSELELANKHSKELKAMLAGLCWPLTWEIARMRFTPSAWVTEIDGPEC